MHEENRNRNGRPTAGSALNRRRALRKLGISAIAVYATPTITHLNDAWADRDRDGHRSGGGRGWGDDDWSRRGGGRGGGPPSGSGWSSKGKGKGRPSPFCPPGLPDCTSPGPGKDGAGNTPGSWKKGEHGPK